MISECQKIKNRKKYLENREDILKKKREYDSIWFMCHCGSRYIISHRMRHFNTKKCLKYTRENINNI